MKSLNFKRKDDSYLRYLEETKSRKTKSPFNWDRLIYLSLLILLLLFLLKYTYREVFYIEGDGQVLFEKVDIRHTDDIRILEFYKKEGDEVEVGDTLFTYFLDDDLFSGGGASNAVSISTAGKSNSWIDKEIYVLKKNIDLNRVRIKDYKTMLESFNNDLERVQNEVILDAVSHTNLENLEYRIEKLENDITLLSAQNGIYRKQLGYLKKLKEDEEKAKKQKIEIQQNTANGTLDSKKVFGLTSSDLLAGINDQQGFNYFTCPIKGSITSIKKQAFEVALKTEIIMALHQPKNVHIRGYFDQEDLSDIHEGNIVDIEFPDGTDSKGRVDRFEFSTRILPEEFQKKFEPTTRTLAVDILPLDSTDLVIWKKYFKLSVKISKRTF